jgi:hypothetical protein
MELVAMYLAKKILFIDFFLIACVLEHHLYIPKWYHMPKLDF